MSVEWRDVKGYEGLYKVSSEGEIKRILFVNNITRKPKETILKQHTTWQGRMTVDLSKNGIHKIMTVHRVVALAFIPNPCNYAQINHIDGNPKNNYVSNLEWCNASYNQKHAYRNGLQKQFREMNERNKKPIIRDDGKQYDCAYSAARDMGVTVFSIRDALKGRTKSCGGHTWRYAE